MIDRFTKKQFEEVLPEEVEHLGLVQGEHVYALPIADSAARIVIRSTIDGNGVAADTGEDSIRLWIEVQSDGGEWKSFSKMKDELGAYTTRVPGWDRRMGEKIETLARVAEKFKRPIPACPDCGDHTIRISKTAKNPNRPFATCWNRQHKLFQWLDEPLEIPKVRVVEEPKNAFDDAGDNGDLFAELTELLGDNPAPQVSAPPVKRKLNNQQASVVMAPVYGAFRVLAGPGSGKTATAEERIARLVMEGAKPGEILYTVFNKSMAEEGGERIGKNLLNVGINYNTMQQYQSWFCTIHAACYRMLRDQIDLTIPDRTYKMVNILKELCVELWPYDKEEGRPTHESLMKAIYNAKYRFLEEGEDRQWFNQVYTPYHGERLTIARQKFDRLMRGNGWLWYNDMLFYTEKLLQNDMEFREKWQGQFKWVICDEGQDVNAQAMRILTTLSMPEGNFTIVGDADQTLNRFAGATPEENLYEGFERRFPNAQTFFLTVNYRSTHKIVQASNSLIRYNYASGGGEYDDKFLKTLVPREDAPEGEEVTFQMYETPEEEAWAIAEEIERAISAGERIPGDFFVGARTKAQLGYLEPVMTVKGIPFINITGGSFWLMKHIRQTVNYLRLAHDESDQMAFKDVHNVASENMRYQWGKQQGEYSPTRWLGTKFLEWCNEKLTNINPYSHECRGYQPRRGWRAGIEDLFDTLHEVQAELKEGGPSTAAQWIIDHVIEPYLREEDGLDDDDNSYKLDDLSTVVDVAKTFDNVEDFVSYIDRAIKAAQDSKNKNWGDYVVLSTIHRLKGLQRPVVYGIGWCEGYSDKTGMPVGLLPHTFSLTDPPVKGPLDMPSRNSISDERDIAFVCVSRAQEEVHLSGVRQWRGALMGPSRFVHEALELVKEKYQ